MTVQYPTIEEIPVPNPAPTITDIDTEDLWPLSLRLRPVLGPPGTVLQFTTTSRSIVVGRVTTIIGHGERVEWVEVIDLDGTVARLSWPTIETIIPIT